MYSGTTGKSITILRTTNYTTTYFKCRYIYNILINLQDEFTILEGWHSCLSLFLLRSSAILYLNEGFEGGEFFFTHTNFTVQVSEYLYTYRIYGSQLLINTFTKLLYWKIYSEICCF